MLRSDKERVVEELTERLRSARTLIVADFRGLKMKEIDTLRGQLLQHGATFSVVKNTLTRRAAEAAGAETVLELLQGPTAIAFLDSDGDPVAVAKALSDAARTTKILTIRGGVLDGAPISDEDVKNLATLPAFDVLQAQLVGAIAGPLTTVVGLFAAPLRDLVGVLDARIRQLGEGEDVVSEPEAPPEPEPAPEPQAAAEELAPEEEPQETEPLAEEEES